jgi:hypothetical protein
MVGKGTIGGRMSLYSESNFNADQAEKRARYNRDMNYLDVFFSDYGDCYTTYDKRLFTGTPYGQADMVPFDASAAALGKYKFLVLMGLNAMDATQANALKAFVQGGGTLIMALGHALNENIYGYRKYSSGGASLLSAAGLTVSAGSSPTVLNSSTATDNNFITYQISGNGATVLKTWEGTNHPKVLEYNLGTGKIILVSTEALHQVDAASTDANFSFRDYIRSYAGQASVVKTSNSASWVETFLMKEANGSLTLAAFNHEYFEGVPDALNGSTVATTWTGDFEIDLQKLGISERNFAITYNYHDSQQGSNVPFTVNGNILKIHSNLTRFAELKIEPIEATSNDNYMNNEEKVLVLYPNPSNGMTFIDVKGLSGNAVRVDVYNLQGRPVHSLSSEAQRISFDTEQFEAGMYLVKVTTKENCTHILKMIVQ